MIGPDFALGRGREGDSTLLSALGREIGFDVEIIPPFTVDGEVVSSTLIRQALAQGDVAKVTKLMGRNFYLVGKVVSADKRGRSLGFPTANLDIKEEQASPGNGVYATIAWLDGRQFASATNIGTRPTFGSGKKNVETYLLGYGDDLYGKELKVEFVQKLRDEQRFALPEELKIQIAKDIQEAEVILLNEIASLRSQ
jgi:riboflavin kinase/FMN adenylyltransferase